MEKFDKMMSGVALLAAIGLSIIFLIGTWQQRELQTIQQQSINQSLSEGKVQYPSNQKLLQKLQQYSKSLETSTVFDINSPQPQIIVSFILVATGAAGVQIFLEKISKEK